MMISEEQIAQMSRQEKLQTMEALWADLSQSVEGLESPPWHEKVIEETAARFDAGEERVVDWSEAKQALRKRIE